MHPLAQQARDLAHEIHSGQLDLAGESYVEHLRRVVAGVGDDPVAQAVAWLHDTVEDHPEAALARLFELPLEVVRPVLILTRLPSDHDTDAYYARIRGDGVALKVKRADVRDNSDKARLARLPPETAERLARKYARATELLGGLSP